MSELPTTTLDRTERDWDEDVRSLAHMRLVDIPLCLFTNNGIICVPDKGDTNIWQPVADELETELDEFTAFQYPKDATIHGNTTDFLLSRWRLDTPVSLPEVLALHLTLSTALISWAGITVGELAYLAARDRRYFCANRNAVVTTSVRQSYYGELKRAGMAVPSPALTKTQSEWFLLPQKRQGLITILNRLRGGFPGHDSLLWGTFAARLVHLIHAKEERFPSEVGDVTGLLTDAEFERIVHQIQRLRKMPYHAVLEMFDMGVDTVDTIERIFDNEIPLDFVTQAFASSASS